MSLDLPDSLTKYRNTHASEYRSQHVEHSRNVLLRDIPKVPQVTLSSLMDAVMPPKPKDWDTICQAVSAQMIVQVSGSDRWGCLPHDPTEVSASEPEVFRFVSQIFEGVKRIASGNSQVACTVAGGVTPWSTRVNSSRPDAYLHYSNPDPPNLAQTPIDWADIIMPMEFKKHSGSNDQRDDFAKVMWSMHHVMRSDPRRRFVFGLTIENTTVRLWFNDRCGLVASRFFDINKDWRALVRIIVGLIRAPEDQLGYDPDMRRVPANDRNLEAQYDITVRSQGAPSPTKYRTIEMLSDVGADSMLGRGTRVWKVQKLVDGVPQGPYYALKDVWVHSDRMPEHELLLAIKKDQKEYAQHFLTVLEAGYVPIAGKFDSTFETIRRGRLFRVVGSPLELLPVKSAIISPTPTGLGTRTISRSQRTSVGHTDNVATPPHDEHRDSADLNRHARLHYRIVFKEIGTPVHELRSYAEVLRALEGGSEGLHALHLGGRVHRDVSSGNIMLVRDPEGSKARGVILDFEYAKDVANPGTSHDVKTGTLAFMATEVGAWNYWRPAFSLRLRQVRVPPFRHNALHDLESIWWILMYMIFYLVHPEDHRTRRHHSNFHAVFKSTSLRNDFWRNLTVFEERTSHLSKAQDLLDIMLMWAVDLQKEYDQSYSRGNFYHIDTETLDRARLERKKIFSKLLDATKGYPWPLHTLSDFKPLLETPPRRGGDLMYVGIFTDKPALI